MASLDRFSEDSRGETLGELKQNGWLYQQEEGFVGKSKKRDIMGYIYNGILVGGLEHEFYFSIY